MKFLMVAYGGGHIAMMLRLYNYFKLNNVPCMLLPLTTAIPYCIKEGVNDFLTLENLMKDYQVSEKVRLLASTLARRDHNPNLEIPFNHTLAYYTIGLAELVGEHGEEEAVKLFEEHSRFCFLPVKFATHVLSTLRMDAVFTTNVPRMELSFVKGAKHLGLPTYAIDDLIGLPMTDFLSDVVFVDNKLAKSNIEKSGFQGEIVVSGNPVYEDLAEYKINYSNESSLLILMQTGIRHLTTKQVVNLNEEFYRVFFSNFENSDLFKRYSRVSVRYHPSMLEKVFWTNEDISIDSKQNTIHDSLANFTDVLGFTSTALYEAYLMGCSTHGFTFGKEYFELPIPYSGTISLKGNFEINNLSGFIKKEKGFLPSRQIIYNKIYNDFLRS